MERIIIMAHNEVGVIADVTRTLADAGINIVTINTETEGHARAASSLRRRTTTRRWTR